MVEFADVTLKTELDGTELVLGADSGGQATPLKYRLPSTGAVSFRNTVADMVADTSLADGEVVRTSGYYTPGDGGSAEYLVGALDNPDGYGTIQLDNNLMATVVDPRTIRQYGGREGLGSGFDNAAPANAMLARLGRVHFPAGNWELRTSIRVQHQDIHRSSLISGDGWGNAIITAVGMSALPMVTHNLADNVTKFDMRDLRMEGDAQFCVDWQQSDPRNLFESQFQNLYLTASQTCIRINRQFSTALINCYGWSTTGHTFELEGGNTTLLQNCYAHTCGPTSAGYRIYTAATMISCNGVDPNSNGYWGEFGGNTAEHGSNSQPRIVMIGCNLEDFNTAAFITHYTGSIQMYGGTFVAKASGTFETYVRIQASNSFLWFEGITFGNKGSTRTGPADVMVQGGQRCMYLSNRDLAHPGAQPIQYDQDGTLYPFGTYYHQAMSGAAHDSHGDYFANSVRDYGFAVQRDTTWTANAATFDVTGQSVIKTANTGATTFTHLSGGIDGQRVAILFRDGVTTVAHQAGGVGHIYLRSQSDTLFLDNDVLELVYNLNTWIQVS